jgi:hypothetical protein
VIDVLADSDALSGRQIEAKLADTDHSRSAIRAALDYGASSGAITTSRGPRNATLHTLTDTSAPVRGSAPPVRQRAADECASAPIGGRTAQSVHTQPSAPDQWTPCNTCGRKTFGTTCRDCQGQAA